MAIIPIRDVPGNPVQPSGNELILIDNGIAMQKATINDAVEPKATEIVDDKIADLELGTAAQADISDFATAAQGDLADTAVQPGDLATVATSGDYNDLSNLPTLGTAAAMDASAFATSEQGALADTAVQPDDLATVATTGAYSDLSGLPTLGTAAAEDASAFAPAAQAVPAGGTTGQVLAKTSDADNAVGWSDAGAGDMLKNVYDPRGIEGDAFPYNSKAEAEGATIPATVQAIRLLGYTSAGDGGGALYKRVESEPTHAGKIQSADGAWWELAEDAVSPRMLGAAGDDTADDSDAVLDAMVCADALGIPLQWGGASSFYRITSGLAMTATKFVSWKSNGATIRVDSATSIRRAIDIELDSHGISTEGTLNIDANEKSFSGLYVTNEGLIKVDARLRGLKVRNCFRADTSFTGGDGIWVSGNFNMVLVTDFSVSNVHMAEGAGVPLSQGVAGVTVTRNSSTGDDANLIIITDFTIDGVYSDDVDYTLDQDGVRAFNSYNSAGVIPRPCTVLISNGRIKNAHGRAIKIQSEWSFISDIMIVRDPTIYGGGFVGNPDIDFQVGGGSARSIQCHYTGNFPSRVVNASLTRDAERLNPKTINIEDLTVYQSGVGAGVDELIVVSSQFDTTIAAINLSKVSLYGSKVPQYCLRFSGTENTRFNVNVSALTGRLSSAVVRRDGDVAPSSVTGSGITLAVTSVPLATAASAGSLTSQLVGANYNVT